MSKGISVCKSPVGPSVSWRRRGGSVVSSYCCSIVLLFWVSATQASTVRCSNSPADVGAIQHAVNRGGTVNVAGTCSLGTAQISINKAVALIGPATMVASSSYVGWTFIENVDDVTFSSLTFTNAGVHVTGSFDTKRTNVNFVNCAFQQFNASVASSPKAAAVLIDPIWKNSAYAQNTTTDVWYGGWANTNNSNANSLWGWGNAQRNETHALLVFGGLDNTRIEYNTFKQISGNGVKVFGNGLSSKQLGYTAFGVSISYNTFELIHRMGIEIQNMTGPNGCTGGCDGFGLNYARAKFAGNNFHTPAYVYLGTFGYSIAVMGTQHLIINNAAIQDLVGNPTVPLGRNGFAFEEPPGTPCCGTNVWNGSASIQGNVIAGDPNPAASRDPGWYAAFAAYGAAAPQRHENMVMCGPGNNHFIGNSSNNDISRYNYTGNTCPAGSGASLYSSDIRPTWISSDRQSFGSGEKGAWNLAVISNLPVRNVQFFVDDSNKAAATQEVQDVNPNFGSDRKWLYHTEIDNSSLSAGSHKITATATDVAGHSTNVSRSFIVEHGKPGITLN
jgi:hypothetical protein